VKLTRLFTEFFNSEKAGGLLLVICTIVSLLVVNLLPGSGYQEMWTLKVGGQSLQHWINDGLMAVFFLLIGLELEREIYCGELKELKHAALPLTGAIGGMLLPVGLYMMINLGSPSQAGAGIPMATDIAFAIGILALLGDKVPPALKVFLIALAVIDDLGAILVIAFFYSSGVDWANLSAALGIFAFLLILNRMKVQTLIPYLAGGVFMWYFMHHSGVHATITGVLLAFAIPFGDGSETTPSSRLQHWLHKPVAFIIVPLFAMANTGISFSDGWWESLVQGGSLGILAGLLIGKPAGILLFTYAGSKLGAFRLPGELRWKYLVGAGMLAGIGFTMSIFITLLSYDDTVMVEQSKIAVLVASVISGAAGFI